MPQRIERCGIFCEQRDGALRRRMCQLCWKRQLWKYDNPQLRLTQWQLLFGLHTVRARLWEFHKGEKEPLTTQHINIIITT